MKTIFKNIAKIITVSSIFLSLSSYAQAPQKMSYQAVLRNAGNALISNTPVAMRVSVLQGSASGTAVYVERHTLTTNINGLATFEIGTGTIISGSFATINWGSGQYFVKTETDPAGGTNYSISGTSQLLSVPYALYAKTVDGVSATNIANWNSAFLWGNHTGLYRPISYVPNWGEVTNKPAFAAVATSGNYNDLTNKPLLDGSETKITAGTNVTVTGAGTIASPYVVNSTGTGTTSPQWTTSGDNISNTNTGNVGIGVFNPIFRLDIDSRIRIGKSSSGTTAGVWLGGSSNSTPAFIGMQDDNTVGLYGDNGAGWGLTMLTNSGNVGIGTSSPGDKLEVAGKTKTTNLQVTNGAGVGKVLTSDASGNATWQSPVAATSNWTATGNNISNTNTGNIGIGASNPTFKLDLAGRMRIRSVTGETAGVWLNNDANTASPAFIGMQADNKVGFYGSGSGWGLTMNTTSGALNINGSAGASGQVPTSNGENQASSWTKLGNLLQTYYRYPQYQANVVTGDPFVFEFGGGSMPINTVGKSRLIISAMFTAYADCGICNTNRSGDIKLKIDGVSTKVFTIRVSPNGVQQTSLSNYFFDIQGGNHTIEWELQTSNSGSNVTSAFISNVTVMVLPVD